MNNDARKKLGVLFEEYQENYDYLMINKQISFATEYQAQQTKIILLSCASYFESELKNTILRFLDTSCSMTESFIRNKAIARQYHTFFDWKEAKNANSFFGLFGDDFKEFMINKVKNDNDFKEAIGNFLELGNLRNQMVHNNFAIFRLDLTVDEIRSKFLSAEKFFILLEENVKEFTKQ